LRREPPSFLLYSVALTSLALVLGCQKQDDHAPFAADCTIDCKPTPGIAIGSGSSSGGTSSTPTDAGFNAGTLTGNILALTDDSFSRASAFTQAATVSADGASGTAVTGAWNGVDPYALVGVAVAPTNWVSVAPGNVQGDALQTFQAVQTDATDTADLVVIDSAVIDGVLTAVSATRAPALGQVVLFFRNAGTGAALAGIKADMNAAEAPAYAAPSGWVLQDDTTLTTSSGLVVFGNVTVPVGESTTQTVTVSRPATATTVAVSGGQFSVRVVEGAVTLASIAVQL
jgi:hypothetical protein